MRGKLTSPSVVLRPFKHSATPDTLLGGFRRVRGGSPADPSDRHDSERRLSFIWNRCRSISGRPMRSSTSPFPGAVFT